MGAGWWPVQALGCACGAALAALGGWWMVVPAMEHLLTMQQLPFHAEAADGSAVTALKRDGPLGGLEAIHHIKAHLTNQLGNHVFQYIYARSLAKALGVSFSSPALGGPFAALPTHVAAGADGAPDHAFAKHLLDRPMNVWMQDTGLYTGAAWDEVVGWLADTADATTRDVQASLPQLGASDIVAHVRLGDIVSGMHASYRPLPFLYYREAVRAVIAAQGGAMPNQVLLVTNEPGHAIAQQLRSSLAAWLATECPGDATASPTVSVYSHSMLGDFALMQRAPNLVLSVSTFSWWAGVLGTGRIVMPLHGNAWPAAASPAFSRRPLSSGTLAVPTSTSLWAACLQEDILQGAALAWGASAVHAAAATGLAQGAVQRAQALPPAPGLSWEVLGSPEEPDQAGLGAAGEAAPSTNNHAVFRLDHEARGAKQCLLLPPSMDHRVSYIALHLGRWGGVADIPSLFAGAPS